MMMKPAIKTMSRGLITLGLLLSTLFTASDSDATVVRLNKGTEVKIRFEADGKISSGTLAKGDSVDIALAEPILMDDSTIVEAGAKGKAVVVEAEKNGRAGKPGHIKLRYVSLQPKGAFTTTADEAILLEGEIEARGKGKKTLSYILLFGLFLKGGNGEIAKSAIYTATIAESIKLKSR
jgi:hypothetical protein